MRKISVENIKIPLPTVRVPAVLAEKRTFCKNQPLRASITTSVMHEKSFIGTEKQNFYVFPGVFYKFKSSEIYRSPEKSASVVR